MIHLIPELSDPNEDKDDLQKINNIINIDPKVKSQEEIEMISTGDRKETDLVDHDPQMKMDLFSQNTNIPSLILDSLLSFKAKLRSWMRYQRKIIQNTNRNTRNISKTFSLKTIKIPIGLKKNTTLY